MAEQSMFHWDNKKSIRQAENAKNVHYRTKALAISHLDFTH